MPENLLGQPCLLLSLPRELRELIYNLLLTRHEDSSVTFGKGSGISIGLLGTCRQVYEEAGPLVTSQCHTLTFDSGVERSFWNRISPVQVRKLERIDLIIRYSTLNRGDCEVEVENAHRLCCFTESFALNLRHNQNLKSIQVDLENVEQRKRGPKRLRSEITVKHMRQILFPFAFLPTRQQVIVGGFDTIEYVNMFADMREAYAGRELPFKTMLYAGLT